MTKQSIREEIWRIMDEHGISRFPGAFGRIPNFDGSEAAAIRLSHLKEYKLAETLKVNPDTPQSHVRQIALIEGKTVLMPSPRLRSGFIVLNGDLIPKHHIKKASTIKGAFQYGENTTLENIPLIDLVVAGSVAVTTTGIRIGKGGGYSEIEYGILREMGKIGPSIPVFTTIHEVQLIENAPLEEHDVLVNAIITPKRVIRIEPKRSQPTGIYWNRLTEEMLEKMSILKQLREKYPPSSQASL